MKKKRPFVPVGNTNRDKRVRQTRGAGSTFCPGCQTRDKRAPPFVPDWRSRLGNRDNRGFPTGTNQRFLVVEAAMVGAHTACATGVGVHLTGHSWGPPRPTMHAFPYLSSY